MAATGSEEERTGGAALGAGLCHLGVARRRGRTLLVRHLPAELTVAEKEDLLQHFGAVAVRVLSDHGRLVRARAGGSGPCAFSRGRCGLGGIGLGRPRGGGARSDRWGGAEIQPTALRLRIIESFELEGTLKGLQSPAMQKVLILNSYEECALSLWPHGAVRRVVTGNVLTFLI